VHPVLVSREQALDWAIRLTRDAAREGLALTQAALPHAVALAPLLRSADPGGDPSLACEVALAHDGPLTIDLVEHGPHAVVGGTTGSGKSELLIAWVLSMAAAHPPERVTFLLVDFKGGSAFSSLGVLPHTVGIITDLHGEAVSRALESLRAEVRYRERLLTDQGARSIDSATGLPRLVIVVDEFAAMIADHPDLHTLFADLAARGRSLGIHLVLCTQRPAGIVRDAVLANADIRVSLRVNNRGDSAAVVGVDAAAEIPAGARGRGVLRVGGGDATLVQFALAAPHDPAEVAARWSNSPAPRRPWCEPLGTEVSLDELEPGEGIAFALVDLPGEQRRETAHFVPAADGHLLVLGAPRSGKSTALAALGQGATWIPNEVGAAWDAISSVATGTLVVVDDLDSLVSRFGVEHRSAFVERLGSLLRDGPVRGIHVVLGAQRLTPDTQSLAALVPSRLLLRHSSRHDWVLAGGDGTTFVESLPPGGGVWKGHRVQVAHVAVIGAAAPTGSVPAAGTPLAIATTRLAELAALLPAAVNLADTPDPAALFAANPETVLIGDVDEWQSRWGVLGSIRPVAHLLLHGCSVSDYRVLTRSRQLPPPIAPDQCWLVHLDGAASRVTLPTAASKS
jgi:S-DNA-T family DNA segregation ATPase FtsK/SpoIIIE